MKRRLLSAFLAVMMVLTMAPVAFAADEGDTAPQSSVSLPANNTGDFTISEEGAVLDGAGVTYKNGTITVTAADVTIKNLTFGDKAKLVVNTSGKFTLTGCTFTPETVCDNATKLPVRTAVTLNVGEAEVTNNTFGGITNGYYNAIEFGIGASNNDLSKAVISGNTFNSAIRNNYFNFYNMTPNAQIDIVNNKLLLAEKSSNGIRISNFRNATGVTFKIDSDEYTYAADSADSVYEGLILLQDYSKGSDVQNFSGITINVTKLSAPKSAKQLLYVYDDHTQSIITTNQPKLTGDDSLAQFYAAKIGDTYYKTLADAVAAAQSGETVKLLKNVTSANILKINQSITLDLGDYTFELTGSGNTARAIYINDGANVTIKANEKGGVKAATIALQVNAGGKLTIESGTYTGMYALALFSSDTKPAEAILNNGVFNGYIYTNGTGHDDHITFNGGTYNEQVYLASGDKSTYTISNGTFKNSLEIDAGRLDISGGTFTANIDTSGNANHPVTNNNGSGAYVGTLVVCKPDGSSATGYIGDAVVNITGGTFENTFANGETIVVADFGKEQENVGDAKVTISDNAKIKGVVKAYASENNTGMNFSISGGYFTTDPSAYVASGYVAGTSDVSGYSYKVVAKTETGNVEVKPAVAKPEVKVDKIPQADKEKVAAAAATVSAPTLGAETGDIVKNINEDTANALIKKATTVQGDNKKLYVQSSLKVEPTAYDAENKKLALEITPQYRVVASTADTADKIKLDGDTNTKNAQVVQDYQTMNITKATVVTMELPTGFAVADGDKLSIQHTKSNDKVEYYTGTVTKKDDKFYLTFTTNGFSPFVISVPAASIGENVYPTLQAAVENVKKNETIKLAKDVDEAIVVTVAKSINFKVDANKKKFDAKKNIVAGTNTTVKVGETSPYIYEFTYTKPSSGGSSGGSSSGKTTYKVTTSAVNNGGVNASPSNAEKGATITITLSPDKGYKLDKLTVTDGSGKTVSTVKKSDTVYTFTMPASAVKVGVSYVKATETPSETKFNDVSANDWFASAVDYVTGKGMMNGTAANTFSPKANTTRGMVVTVLYRLENQPSTSAASFTDVASGAYYANAVAWANANGIVSGYGSGKFGPNDKVTREQLAAILYRYAQYKKYDVSGANSLDGYTDVQSVSSYAVPALQWANAAGVVTGKSGSKLDPKGNATRAEVAAMLMRFCENVK